MTSQNENIEGTLKFEFAGKERPFKLTFRNLASIEDRLGKPVNNSYWSEIVICNDIITASERNELYNYLVSVG